jgi:hypothetical protein
MTRLNRALALGFVATLGLAGCATPPLGPTVAVMPGPGKAFDVFANDQAACKAFASQQVSGEAQLASNRGVGTAVVSTVLGAGLGAAIGGGRGAVIGAASGAVLGAVAGAGKARWGSAGVQQSYDLAFEQCMYAKGNQVAGYATPVAAPPAYPAPLPPAPSPPIPR